MSRYKAGIMKPGFNPLAAVAAGGYNNSLYAWGWNSTGQLGLNDAVSRSTPIQVGALSTWLSVSAGYQHSLAVKADGTLWAWGGGDNGKLGLNTTNINRSSPTQVGSGTTWLKVSAGSGGQNFSAAIKTDGTLWTWGNSNYGQLGISIAYIDSYNPYPDRSSPVQVGALSTWSSVSAGINTVAAIKTDGTLWTWGYNYYGGLGKNDLVLRSSPVQVGSLTNWLSVISTNAGAGNMCAIKTDGTIWMWGSNAYGALGQNDTTNRSSPTQVGALTNWLSVSAGGYFSAAIKTDGTLWAWGTNNYGQLGINDTANRSSPTQVGALTNWASVGCGYLYTTAIKTDGTLWTWGYNGFGQLGQNDLVFRSSPVQVGSLTSWSTIHAGHNYIIAGI